MAAAALPVVGGLIGGIFQRRSENRQLQAQERARQEALSYERQQSARGEQRARRAYETYRNNWQRWFQTYGRKGIDRYGMPSGIDVTRLRAPGQAGGAAAGPTRRPFPGPGAPRPGYPPTRPPVGVQQTPIQQAGIQTATPAQRPTIAGRRLRDMIGG